MFCAMKNITSCDIAQHAQLSEKILRTDIKKLFWWYLYLQVVVGDQDQFIHLWRYEGGYKNLDENMK